MLIYTLLLFHVINFSAAHICIERLFQNIRIRARRKDRTAVKAGFCQLNEALKEALRMLNFLICEWWVIYNLDLWLVMLWTVIQKYLSVDYCSCNNSYTSCIVTPIRAHRDGNHLRLRTQAVPEENGPYLLYFLIVEIFIRHSLFGLAEQNVVEYRLSYRYQDHTESPMAFKVTISTLNIPKNLTEN